MIIKINKNQNGVRLDKFLFSKYKNSNLIDIQKFINKKEIKVNDRKVEPKYVLEKDDEIIFNSFIEKILENPTKNKNIKKNKKVDEKHNRLITENIIFQNENLLVINKPAGLSVQGGSGVSISVDGIIKNLNDKNTNLKLVHRLDKDTSGVLLIAKNIETANTLTEAFKHKESITKEYLLFVIGKPTNTSGIIDLPLLKKYNNNVEKVYVDKKNGKEAVTKYEVLNFSKKYDISLVKATILTGRTHQIRVHFKEIGCPIIGDFKYGNSQKNFNNIINPEKKLLLHSWHTSLILFGEKYNFVAKLPAYMKKIGELLEFNQL